MTNNLLTKNLNGRARTRPVQIKHPELIFGIVGPIGVDLDQVIESLKKHLASVDYKSETIHLTDYMDHPAIKVAQDKSTYYKKYISLIRYANEFRKAAKNAAALAGIAILKIREHRKTKTKSVDEPALNTAYIIRQFKRPEEIELMRRVYGRKFIQVSVYGSPLERRNLLIGKIHKYDSSPKKDPECERQAIDLIDIDYNEKENSDGQRLSDVFHLGDVFTDGIDKQKSDLTINRFINAFFGRNDCSPNKDEYGLYIASAAALRSVDLSRQVGAAIFSKSGEVLSLGCNEVPKAGGGTYWSDDDQPIYRDIEMGGDANQDRKNEMLFDLIQRMSKESILAERLQRLNDSQKQMTEISKLPSVLESQIMDIIEYGRMIHAEMSAISDAARLGRGILGSTLYCTTFPCHICAKHIVAAGIDRVVFLEPYPKSYAQKLHSDSITFEENVNKKVLFKPFIGISPRRYRDIFEKKKRKDNLGKARDWYEGAPVPMIEDKSASYIDNEDSSVFFALGEFRPPRGRTSSRSNRPPRQRRSR